MAKPQAIAVVALAVRDLLARRWEEQRAPSPEFKVFSSRDFQPNAERSAAISVYLHRVAFNTTRRNLAPRRDSAGMRFRPSVPLDVHLLITAWGRSMAEQHNLLGWAIRAIEDEPTLPAGVLNASAGEWGHVFPAHESIEIVGEALTAQELVNIWEVAKANQQPSVSYVARSVFIDSEFLIADGELVQTRVFDFLKPRSSARNVSLSAHD
jgi:hypothetical protein